METSVSVLTTDVMVFLTVMTTQMKLIAVSILMRKSLNLFGEGSQNFVLSAISSNLQYFD